MLAFFISLAFQLERVTLKSPDGTLECVVSAEDPSMLSYEVFMDGNPIQLKSRIGIVFDRVKCKAPFKLLNPVYSSFSETYKMLGAHSIANNTYNCVVFNVLDSKGSGFKIEFRCYNDGVAYRYILPKGKHHVKYELTSWNFPKEAYAFAQPSLSNYEGTYIGAPNKDVPPSFVIGLPVLINMGQYFALATEGNTINYSDLGVITNLTFGLTTFFHADSFGFSFTGEETPFRITIITRTLTALVNSDLVRNVCPGKDIPSWVKPGRSSWQWLNSGAPKLEEQKWWVQKTKEIGFEYYLIDDGWKDWKEGNKTAWELLTEVVSYAKTEGVECFLWVDSKDLGPDYLKKTKESGVVGIKIDFIPPMNAKISNWYDKVLSDAYDLELMVNYHGAVKPSGRERTWPNEIAREAVSGHEQHSEILNRILPAHHETILPFTRYVQGHADYTPTIANLSWVGSFTCSREIAEAIILSAPFLCYGDRPDNYLSCPALPLIKAIPPVYDETLVLDGTIVGMTAAFARRKGDDWFIGIIENEAPRPFSISTSFLSEGEYDIFETYDVAGKRECNVRTRTIKKGDVLTLEIAGQGGYAAHLAPHQNKEL